VSWTNATTCVVDTAVTLTAAAITSVQLPIATFVNSAGVTQGWMNAAGNVYFAGNVGIGISNISQSFMINSLDPLIEYDISNVLKGYSGISGGTDRLVTGSVLGDYVFRSQGGRILFNADSGTTINMGITSSGNILTGGLTAAGTSAVKVIAMGEATAPTTSPANGAQLWPENLDANGGNNRFWTRTEDGVHSPIAIKSETDAQANPKAPSQGVNMTAAASGSSGITVGDDADLDWGTGDGAVRIVYTLLDHTPSAVQYLLYRYEDAANYIYLQVETSGALTLKATVDTGIAWNTSSNAPSFVDGTMHDVLVALDRDGNLTYYIDGVAAGTLDISADAAKSMDIAAALYALGTSAVRTAGTVQSVEWFNRCPSAAEVLDLYRNGVSFADKWGSQTALSSDTAWTGATGATPPTGWSSVNGGVYTIFDSSDGAPYDACLKIEHGGAQNYPYIKKSSPVTVVIGKKYRFSFAFKHGTSTNGAVGLGTSDAGVEYQIWNTLTDATWTIYTKEFTATSTNVYYYLQSNTAISGQYELFDEVTLTEIGATLALEEKGIWLDKWYDSSSNNLVASYPTVGWTLTQQANKKRVKQPTPTAETTAVTLTIAKLLTGIITATHTAGATQAYTLPTGALTDAWPAFGINDYFDWYLINLSAAAADTVTVTAAATGHTIVGNPIVQSAHSSTGGVMGNSAGFRTRKTAAATFVSYRIN